MTRSPRRIAALLLAAAALLGCGGTTGTTGNPTGKPTVGAGTSAPATQAPGGETTIAPLGSALLAPIFGTSIPTPACQTRTSDAESCRWTSADGKVVLDVSADPTFQTEQAWRDAYATAGFDQEIPGIGVAALGGDNPLSDGFRASVYTEQGIAFTVTLAKAGDAATAKALVTAILAALAA